MGRDEGQRRRHGADTSRAGSAGRSGTTTSTATSRPLLPFSCTTCLHALLRQLLWRGRSSLVVPCACAAAVCGGVQVPGGGLRDQGSVPERAATPTAAGGSLPWRQVQPVRRWSVTPSPSPRSADLTRVCGWAWSSCVDVRVRRVSGEAVQHVLRQALLHDLRGGQQTALPTRDPKGTHITASHTRVACVLFHLHSSLFTCTATLTCVCDAGAWSSVNDITSTTHTRTHERGLGSSFTKRSLLRPKARDVVVVVNTQGHKLCTAPSLA
jgi:hypothetical protein